jgi:hypothetical protein
MYNFESVNSAKQKKFNKWHLIWVLFALNLLGFAAAKVYFKQQNHRVKAETETVDYPKTYGANVKHPGTLLDWSLQLVHFLRGRN